MDKSALKDKRRETVIGLLKGMKIKTGRSEGFDKEDVYECIQKLTNLYEDHIDELELNYDAEINDLSKRYHKYDENNELYVSLIMEAKKSSNEIISQAKAEVDEILRNGKEQVELQERELEQFKTDCEKKKTSLEAELKASKDVAEAEIAAMRVDIEAEKEKLEATKNKYKQQIAAMEDEFAEIKTNILRTSARLDSLKAQTEEVVSLVEWEVEPATSVQMPQADIEVDDVVEVEKAPEPTFEETFFKSEVLEEAPKIEEAAPQFVAPPIEEAAPQFVAPPIEEVAPKFVAPPIEEAAPQFVAPPIEEAAPQFVEPSIEDLIAEIDAVPNEPAPVAEEIAKPDNEVETLLDEISFDDFVEEKQVEEVPEEIEEIGEINLEELISLEAEPAIEEVAEPVTEVKANPVNITAGASDEISFESLEALFKEEK